jgi:hypothetical protein
VIVIAQAVEAFQAKLLADGQAVLDGFTIENDM